MSMLVVDTAGCLASWPLGRTLSRFFDGRPWDRRIWSRVVSSARAASSFERGALWCGRAFPPTILPSHQSHPAPPPSVIIVILLSTHSIRSSPPFALFPTLSLNHRSQSVDVPRQHRRRHRHRLCYHRSWRNVPRSWDQSAGGASCIASSCLLLVTVRIKGQREISSSRKQKCLAPP